MIEKIEDLFDALQNQAFVSKIKVLSLNIELDKVELLTLMKELRAAVNNYMIYSIEEIEELFKTKEHTFLIVNGRKLIVTLKEEE